MSRSTVARIYPRHLLHNAAQVRHAAPASRIMACVKADAYGHGLIAVANCLERTVDGFAVACLEEALALRDGGIRKAVLLLEGPQSPREIHDATAAGLTVCLGAWHQLEWLEQASLSTPLSCWLNIDTGMHRLGFSPGQVAEAAQRLLACPGAQRKWVFATHFARAGEPENESNRQQLQCFDAAREGLPGRQSLANSAAILAMPESHRDWVRPGYMLYGGSPFAERSHRELQLKPVMELSAAVIALRDIATGEPVGYGGRWVAQRPSRIATVAAGYGDGYPRHARNGTPVLLEGKRLPLAGTVSMDMLTVDVTDHPAVKIGSRAVLWGDNPGVDEVATHADTIGYELLAALPARVPREMTNYHDHAGADQTATLTY